MKGRVMFMMARGLLGVIIVGNMLIGGCAVARPWVGPESRYVELDVRTHGQRCRVYASPRWGARVDVVIGTEEKVTTAFIPANASEVERIIRTLGWVHRGRATESTSDRERIRDGALLDVSFDDGTRITHYELGSYQREMNLVWDGIINEIEATASVQLAISISEQAIGTSQLEKGEFGNAVRSQEMSLQALDHWLRIQAKRCGFLYHFRGTYSFNGVQVRLQELPTSEELFELPGATPELVARLLRQIWGDWLSHYATVVVVDDIYIVKFTGSFNRERGDDAKLEIEESAIRELKNRKLM